MLIHDYSRKSPDPHPVQRIQHDADYAQVAEDYGEEERERLKKWDEFLEGDDDETDKNPAQAKQPAANNKQQAVTSRVHPRCRMVLTPVVSSSYGV